MLILTCQAQVPWGLKYSQVTTFLLCIPVQRQTCIFILSNCEDSRFPFFPAHSQVKCSPKNDSFCTSYLLDFSVWTFKHSFVPSFLCWSLCFLSRLQLSENCFQFLKNLSPCSSHLVIFQQQIGETKITGTSTWNEIFKKTFFMPVQVHC